MVLAYPVVPPYCMFLNSIGAGTEECGTYRIVRISMCILTVIKGWNQLESMNVIKEQGNLERGRSYYEH